MIGGSSVNWALFPSKKAEELLGFSPIFPPIYVWQSYKQKKNLQLPQSSSHLLEKLENWVFPKGRWQKSHFMDFNDALQLLNSKHVAYLLLVCNDLKWTLSNYHHWMQFLRSLIDFIQFSLLFFTRMFEIEGTHVSHVQD